MTRTVSLGTKVQQIPDADACCVICGFDGAEWWHWKHNTYEGRASDCPQPSCAPTPKAKWDTLNDRVRQKARYAKEQIRLLAERHKREMGW